MVWQFKVFQQASKQENREKVQAAILVHLVVMNDDDDQQHKKKFHHICTLHDDNNRVDINNANNAVSILNSIDDHIAFVLPIPDIAIASSSIRNNTKFVTLTHCVSALMSTIAFSKMLG